MHSLSMYDKGKKCYEGRTYWKDIDAAHKGMARFMAPIREEQARQRRNKEKVWKPGLDFFLGNHEYRIVKAVEADRMLEGTLSLGDLGYEDHGWTVHPFLKVVSIDGIYYSHYFTSGPMGRAVSSARYLVQKKHASCIMGHVQHRDIAYDRLPDGKQITSIFAGCYYLHDEDYLGEQGNSYWRGCWMLHNVDNGSFDELPIPLGFFKEKYGTQSHS